MNYQPMIHVQGYFSGYSGWARHANEFSTALERYTSISRQDLKDVSKKKLIQQWISTCYSRFRGVDAIACGLTIGPMEQMLKTAGNTRISYVVWETSIIPPSRKKYLESSDQIWTPSEWGRELLIDNGVPQATVKVVPEGVNTEHFRPIQDSHKPARPVFRFLCIGKWEARKGIEGLLETYCTTFTKMEPVELLLCAVNSCIPGHSTRDMHDYIASRYPEHPPITLIDTVSEQALVELYNSADVFVLPTRAEGWGLTIIEAMACGLPVIVTRYSGYMDYVTPESSYLIDVDRMVPVDDQVFFGDGEDYGVWAQPDLGHLAEIMRYVAENQEEVKHKGNHARSHVVDHWSWDKAAQKAMALPGMPSQMDHS